jgi:hypothetical protein
MKLLGYLIPTGVMLYDLGLFLLNKPTLSQIAQDKLDLWLKANKATWAPYLIAFAVWSMLYWLANPGLAFLFLVAWLHGHLTKV